MTFIERVTELRQEKGVTEKQVLLDCGLSKNSFVNWKKGIVPHASAQNILAAYFGVSADYLMGKTDNPIPHTEQIGTYLPYEKRGFRPVVGWASAGTGVIAEEMIIDWEQVDDEYDNENCFWIEVAGDSMSPKIDNGDRVLVQKDAEIESGNIVVVVIDGTDGYLKQLEVTENSIILHSVNPYYPDMVFPSSDEKRLHFIGRVREMKRKF